MPPDSRPISLIPAYKPTPAAIKVADEILASGRFQAVVCVDDGSGEDYRSIFDRLSELGLTIIRHHVNLGKGMALKTGINVIAVAFPDSAGVVTLDADGQHLAKDVVAVGQALQENPNTLVLGCRSFTSNVPLRSRFGNVMTRNVMRFLTGINATDTQTGLRGIPRAFLGTLLRLPTTGYDFELDMLIKSKAVGVPLLEVPISTIYIDENASSHFRPLWDSLAIYFVLLRHTANAIVTAALDYLVFALSLAFGSSIFAAIAIGRLVAGASNFFIGKKVVFKSKGNAVSELGRYAALVVTLMLLSYGAITLLVQHSELSPYVSKLLVEAAIFLISFSVQRVFVFSPDHDRNAAMETDWNTYYSNRKSSGSPTRKITERLLLSEIARHERRQLRSITEFGGGDSCFYEAFASRYPNAHYLVADKSTRGVEKFLSKYGSRNVSAIAADLLAVPDLPQAELVYSVGLIEHFDESHTARMIKAHFDSVKPGGLVVITYPTPTWLYRLIRGAAEMLGIWKFPDERPLLFTEVGAEVEKYGTVLTRRINWFIGLTQEIIVVKKRPNAHG